MIASAARFLEEIPRPVILPWMRMRRRRREAPQLGVLALVALTATLLSVARAGSAGDDAERVAGSAWRGLVGAPRQEVAVGQRVIVVLNTPAVRPDRTRGRPSR